MASPRLSKKYRVARNVATLIRNSLVDCGAKNIPEKEVLEAIVRRYGEIAQQTILNGFEWAIPIHAREGNILKKVGELNICVEKKIIRDAHDIDPSTGKKVYNPRRPNEKHSIAWQSDLLKGRKMKFTACQEMRKNLKEILFNTHREYRLAQ